MQEAEHDDGCASELEEPSLESAERKARYRRKRRQWRKRAARKGEHSQSAGGEISLCKNIQLKRLREPAGQKEGGRAEYERPSLSLALGQVMDAVRERLRHGRHEARERREQFEHLQAEQNHHHARRDSENAIHLGRERQRGAEGPDGAR